MTSPTIELPRELLVRLDELVGMRDTCKRLYLAGRGSMFVRPSRIVLIQEHETKAREASTITLDTGLRVIAAGTPEAVRQLLEESEP